jgi:hypothetical protein
MMAFDASQNQAFYDRVAAFARSLQGDREEAQQLVDIWNAEGISGDPDFVAVPPHTTGEITDMITVSLALLDFFNNAAVATADRKANLTPFLIVS